jgi:hypothetical protein
VVEPARALSGWPAVDSSGWGAPFDAFPVDTPFEVRPDLVKLAPADDWLRVDRDWAPMVAAKLTIRSGGADNVSMASACDERTARRRLEAVNRIVDKLAATAAGERLGVRRSADGIAFAAAGYHAHPAQGRLRLQATRVDAAAVVPILDDGDDAPRLLGALAMSLQEDLVLMEQGVDGVARAALLQVDFPSAWDPAAKVGQDFHGLHAPVADNAALQAAAARLANALVDKGPFVRWVWTVTTHPGWRVWPPAAPQVRPEASSPLYFRLERQSTMPLGEGYALFLIRVQVRPLDQVLAPPGRLELLQASLRSMSDAMVRYKNLEPLRDRLLRWPPPA